MKVREITSYIEQLAPLSLQEDYDNSGLQVGNLNAEVTGVLLCLDITPEVMREAQERGANLIVSHHPMIFRGIKSIGRGGEHDSIIIEAIKKDISIYSAHTNLDSMLGGVSYALAEKLGMQQVKPLQQAMAKLYKVVVFVPRTHTQIVKEALFADGAGRLGDYESCSFVTEGTGSFKPMDAADPFIGENGKQEYVAEDRLEVLVKEENLNAVKRALVTSHPYEEPAYDVILLENTYTKSALGVIGILPEPMNQKDFLQHVKNQTGAPMRYNDCFKEKIQKVALCGGSGSFLIRQAAAMGADAYLTGDIKYHDFFGYADKMLLTDIGHYESEQFTLDLLANIIAEKTDDGIEIYKTNIKTNPINYF